MSLFLTRIVFVAVCVFSCFAFANKKQAASRDQMCAVELKLKKVGGRYDDESLDIIFAQNNKAVTLLERSYKRAGGSVVELGWLNQNDTFQVYYELKNLKKSRIHEFYETFEYDLRRTYDASVTTEVFPKSRRELENTLRDGNPVKKFAIYTGYRHTMTRDEASAIFKAAHKILEQLIEDSTASDTLKVNDVIRARF